MSPDLGISKVAQKTSTLKVKQLFLSPCSNLYQTLAKTSTACQISQVKAVQFKKES